LLLIVLSGASLSAHDFSQSESVVTTDGPMVKVRISLNLLELPDVDTSRNGVVSYEELDAAIERVFDVVRTHYVVGAPDAPTRTSVERHGIADEHVLTMDVRYDFGHDVRRLDVTSTLDEVLGPTHQHFLTANIAGESARAVLDAANRRAHFDRARVVVWQIAAVGVAVLGLALMAWLRRVRQST
jgi:hypothetical protein